MAKRGFDLVVATCALLLLAPLLLAVAVWVRLDSPGPALFRQVRVGRGGRPFAIHKFRTMVVDAAQRGPALTIGDDARITRAGRWLRRSRVDELPQLIDVVRGDMSLVGPRPELPRYVAQVAPALRAQWLALRPGLTDPASLARLDESAQLARAADPEREYLEVLLPHKLALSLAYARQATLASDLGVLWRTVVTLLRRGSPAGRADPARRARWHHVERGLARLRPWRQPLTLAIDALVVVVAWQLTYLFRLGFERWWSARADYDGWVLAGVVAVYLAAFVVAGVPRGLWRFTGFGELRRIALACLAAGACAAIAVRAAELVQIPRAVLALHPFVTLVGIALLRLAFRMLHEHLREQRAADGSAPQRALVLGAGEAARLLLAGIHRQGWTVLGLLDDDPAKHGARIAGVPVLGPLSTLAEHARRSGATQLIYAMPSARGARRREVFALAAATGLPLLTVPSAAELREGSAVERLRDLRAEDLLGRDPVRLDEAGLRETLAGRTVLVTGAGGSIGSELCRQIAGHGPARLLLFEQAEFNLYAIEQELARAHPGLALQPLIGDVRDLAALRAVCARWRPQVVFHAAAYKHVPLMEDEANAWACVRNNVLGTCHAALAASEAGGERFVLISTDKAVQPGSVMGASKRAAERVVATLAASHPGTRFMAVRFGNVLGSSGSVVPKFKQQIERGGPVTVTHPDVIRYFMTIPEAVQLVLQAATVGDSGQVLVLDMGEPVRIVDLARQLIALAGRRDDEIAIEYTGLRAGEKLSEALLAEADETLPTTAARVLRVRLATPALDLAALRAALAPTTAPTPDAARALLAQWVPEYAEASARAQRAGSKR